MTETLSHSAINTFQGCPRKFRYMYEDGYRVSEDDDTYAQMLGKAVHAGLAEALLNYTLPVDELIRVARAAVIRFCDENTTENKTIMVGSTPVADEAYYQKIRTVRDVARDILSYQIPRIGIGSRYVPLSHEGVPMVEWEFDFTLDGEPFRGRVDAVVFDTLYGVNTIIDWKVRTSFDRPDAVAMDNQLMLYASVVNDIIGAGTITKLMQVQMKNAVPKPAAINKNGQPSVAAQATTWEVWSNDIRNLGMNPEKWREEIEPKLSTEEDFFFPVAYDFTGLTETIIRDNIRGVIAQVGDCRKRDFFPRHLSAGNCGKCPFWRVCSADLAGGDENAQLERYFKKKD